MTKVAFTQQELEALGTIFGKINAARRQLSLTEENLGELEVKRKRAWEANNEARRVVRDLEEELRRLSEELCK